MTPSGGQTSRPIRKGLILHHHKEAIRTFRTPSRNLVTSATLRQLYLTRTREALDREVQDHQRFKHSSVYLATCFVSRHQLP